MGEFGGYLKVIEVSKLLESQQKAISRSEHAAKRNPTAPPNYREIADKTRLTRLTKVTRLTSFY